MEVYVFLFSVLIFMLPKPPGPCLIKGFFLVHNNIKIPFIIAAKNTTNFDPRLAILNL